MNTDLYYHGTVSGGSIAGFENEEATVIDHTAQYVDKSNQNMVKPEELKNLTEGLPQPTVMENNESDSINPTAKGNSEQTTKIQKDWMAFHFLPGNFDNFQNSK